MPDADPIEPRFTAQQDQARAMAAQCAPILYASYNIAIMATDTDRTAQLLLSQCVKDGWSAIEAMALAIEMMRRAYEAEHEHAKLRRAITTEQIGKGAEQRQAVIDAARAWHQSLGQPVCNDHINGCCSEESALIEAIEALPDAS